MNFSFSRELINTRVPLVFLLPMFYIGATVQLILIYTTLSKIRIIYQILSVFVCSFVLHCRSYSLGKCIMSANQCWGGRNQPPPQKKYQKTPNKQPTFPKAVCHKHSIPDFQHSFLTAKTSEPTVK